MPQPTIYPGSFNEIYDQLEFQQNYGIADIIKDSFQTKLDATTKTSPPLLSYPIDLGESPENQFMIRFDIYETGGAALSNKRAIQNFSVDVAKLGAEGKGAGFLQQVGGLVASSASGIVDSVVSTFQGEVQNADTLGKGRDSFVEESLGIHNLTTHAGSVYMYLPGSISIGYKFEYEDADMSSLDILKGLRSLTETQTGSGAVVQAEMARKLGMSALKTADSITEIVGGQDALMNSVKSSSRQVENPFVVHMFKGVGRRTFKFSFTMIPRSAKEAMAINTISTMFRTYAHPKRSAGGRFLDFPAEFGIAFLYKQQENIRLPKIRKCSLAGINMSYGENTFTSTKPDADGKVNPTKVVMELEFAELEILTQQSVTEQGA